MKTRYRRGKKRRSGRTRRRKGGDPKSVLVRNLKGNVYNVQGVETIGNVRTKLSANIKKPKDYVRLYPMPSMSASAAAANEEKASDPLSNDTVLTNEMYALGAFPLHGRPMTEEDMEQFSDLLDDMKDKEAYSQRLEEEFMKFIEQYDISSVILFTKTMIILERHGYAHLIPMMFERQQYGYDTWKEMATKGDLDNHMSDYGYMIIGLIINTCPISLSYLLEMGVNLNQEYLLRGFPSEDILPLDLALRKCLDSEFNNNPNDKRAIVRMLIEHGADPSLIYEDRMLYFRENIPHLDDLLRS